MDEISVDLESMTIGELEDFEEIVGRPLGELDAEHFPAKAIKAIVYLMRRRENPDFTLEQARALRIGDVKFADPTQAGTTGS